MYVTFEAYYHKIFFFFFFLVFCFLRRRGTGKIRCSSLDILLQGSCVYGIMIYCQLFIFVSDSRIMYEERTFS